MPDDKQEQVIKELIRRLTQEKYAEALIELKVHEHKIMGGKILKIEPKLG
jgi:hypothetical protein